MTETKLLLAELDAVLRKCNMTTYLKLQSPLPDEEIDKYFEELGIADEDLKALYQWKNGEQEGSYSQLIDNGGIQSLQEIKNYLSFKKLYDSDLLEIVSDNGEGALLFNKRKGPHYGRLYFFSVPCLYIEHPISYVDSINAMLRTTIEACMWALINMMLKQDCEKILKCFRQSQKSLIQTVSIGQNMIH